MPCLYIPSLLECNLGGFEDRFPCFLPPAHHLAGRIPELCSCCAMWEFEMNADPEDDGYSEAGAVRHVADHGFGFEDVGHYDHVLVLAPRTVDAGPCEAGYVMNLGHVVQSPGPDCGHHAAV